jgi:hypothetical protein
MEGIREARLRPEYAELYPDLTPGIWVPATVLSEFVLERGLYQRRTGSPSHARLLAESHFDFRGGRVRREQPWSGPNERLGGAVPGSE